MNAAALPLIVRKPIWPFAIVIAFAAIGAACLLMLPNIYSDPRRFWVAYLLCAFAGGGVVHLVQRKPDLIISMDGIQASAWGSAMVRWNEIERAFVVQRSGIDHLCLSLVRAGEFYQRSGPLVRLMMTTAYQQKLGDLMFQPSSLRLNTKDVLALINELADWHNSDLKPPVSAVRYHIE